jgi:1-acyl-sn-glycerol-3-phosphate acyltransferase
MSLLPAYGPAGAQRPEYGNKPTPSRFGNAVSWCRSIFVLGPLICLYTIVLGACSLLVSFADRRGRIQHQCARVWSWLILKTSLSSVQVSGAERLVCGKPRVYAANHVSSLDIPLLYAHIPGQFRIMAKQEWFRYPFLGWHLRRSGQLAIDPSKRSTAVSSLRKAVETLQKGMPLVIFPEGGRSRNGQIQKFMSGAFYLAIKAQAEIVPTAIAGTYEILPPEHAHLRPGRIDLLIGEPISTAGLGLGDIDALSDCVQRAVEDLYYAHSRVSDPRKAAAAAN